MTENSASYPNMIYELIKHVGTGAGLTFLLAAALCPVSLCADQIISRDASFPTLTIVGTADGDLHVRLPDGSIQQVPLVETLRIVADSVGEMKDFNRAERYNDEFEYQQAAVRYERALRSADGFWLKIIEQRLVRVYAASGKLERAITYFIRVVGDSPRAAARIMPESWPTSKVGPVRRAIKRLKQVPAAKNSPDRSAVLELLAYHLSVESGGADLDLRAAEVARLGISAAIATRTIYEIKLAAMRRQFDAGDPADVLISLEAALHDCPDEALAELLLLRGQALFLQAKNGDDLLEAGLTFMRVAIHHPEDECAPAALLGAALVHEKLELSAKAARLARECLAHPGLTEPVQEKIDLLLRRLAEEAEQVSSLPQNSME